MKKILSLFLILLFNTQSIIYAASTNIIPAGTPVSVGIDKEIDADDIKLGQLVEFTTLEPVKVNGVVVIKPGTLVTGQITKRKNNCLFGVPGEVQVGNFQVRTDKGDIVNLRGNVGDKGDNRYWVNAGLIWIVTLPMIFIKGNDGKIAPGTKEMLYTVNEINL